MTRRALAWLVLAPCGLAGQLRLFSLEGQSERLVTGTLDLGAVETGDARETPFRLRNTGLITVRLDTLMVAGAGFTLVQTAPAPRSLEPGAAVDFAVRFEPPAPGDYSALLWLNSQSVVLRAVGLPSAVLSVETPAGYATLTPALPVDFETVELDSAGARRFRLENPNSVALEVNLAVTGASFRGPAGLDSPVHLAPRQAAAFEVLFEPRTAGLHEGQLKVNQRSFRLRGTGRDPPLPKPQILFDPPETASGRYVRLSIRLASPARGNGTGEVEIGFEPYAASAPDDVAIQLLPTGARRAGFAVGRGEDVARFGDRPEIELQTGTTAGRILVVARLGTHVEQASLSLAPMPVVITSVNGARHPEHIEVNVVGFDNTRTAASVAFAFFDSTGSAVAPGRVAIDAAGEFRRHFESNHTGGIFGMRAAFPVIGDGSVIAALEVELTNSVGVTRSERVSIGR